MKLQTLVSTMRKKNYDLFNKMNIKSDAVFVNQCSVNSREVFGNKDQEIIWINSSDRGLSKSRNMAIETASADICVLADDDLIFVEDAHEIIVEEFKKNTNIDIITFQVEGIDREFKRYYKSPRNLNYLTSMKVASVEIAFRLDSIKRESIQFNEMFGAGAKHKMGEENIFLFECLKKGLKIKYIPKKIANLHVGDSSWFNGYTRSYFFDLGSVYAEMSKRYSYLLIMQYAIRKYKLYKNNINLYNAIKAMFDGRKTHLRERIKS